MYVCTYVFSKLVGIFSKFVIRYLFTLNKLYQSYSHFFEKYRGQFQCSFIISSAILETHYYKLLYQFPICVFVNYPCVCLPLKIGCTSKCDWVKSLLKEQCYINTGIPRLHGTLITRFSK